MVSESSNFVLQPTSLFVFVSDVDELVSSESADSRLDRRILDEDRFEVLFSFHVRRVFVIAQSLGAVIQYDKVHDRDQLAKEKHRV